MCAALNLCAALYPGKTHVRAKSRRFGFIATFAPAGFRESCPDLGTYIRVVKSISCRSLTELRFHGRP